MSINKLFESLRQSELITKILLEETDSPHEKRTKQRKVTKDFQELANLGRAVYNDLQSGRTGHSFKIKAIEEFIKKYFPNLKAKEPSVHFYGFVGLYYELDERIKFAYNKNPNFFTQDFFKTYFRQLDKLRRARYESSKFEMEKSYQDTYYQDVALVPRSQKTRMSPEVDREKARDMAKEQYKMIVDELSSKLSFLKVLSPSEEEIIDEYIKADSDDSFLLNKESEELGTKVYNELSGSEELEDTIEYAKSVMPDDLVTIHGILQGADEEDIEDYIQTVAKRMGYQKPVDISSEEQYLDVINYGERENVDPLEIEKIKFARNFIMGHREKTRKLSPEEYMAQLEERNKRKAEAYSSYLDRVSQDVVNITPEMIEKELGRMHVRTYTFKHLTELIGAQLAIPNFDIEIGESKVEKIAKELNKLSSEEDKISYIRNLERDALKSHIQSLSDEDLAAYIRSIANESILQDQDLSNHLSSMSIDQKVDYILSIDTDNSYTDEQLKSFIRQLNSDELIKKIKKLTPSVAGLRQDTVAAYAASAFLQQHPDETSEVFEAFTKVYLLTLLAIERQAQVDEGREGEEISSEVASLISHLCGEDQAEASSMTIQDFDLEGEALSNIGNTIYDYFQNNREYEALNEEYRELYEENNGDIPQDELIRLNMKFKDASEKRSQIQRVGASIENINGLKSVVTNIVKSYYIHLLNKTYDEIRGTTRKKGVFQEYCEANDLPWSGIFENLSNKIAYFATSGTFKTKELDAYPGSERSEEEINNFVMDLLGRRKGRGQSVDIKKIIDRLPANDDRKSFVFTRDQALKLAEDCSSESGIIGKVVHDTFSRDYQERPVGLLEDILSYIQKMKTKGFNSVYEYIFCMITEGMIQNLYYSQHEVAIVLPLALSERISEMSKDKFKMICKNFPEYLTKMKEILEP